MTLKEYEKWRSNLKKDDLVWYADIHNGLVPIQMIKIASSSKFIYINLSSGGYRAFSPEDLYRTYSDASYVLKLMHIRSMIGNTDKKRYTQLQALLVSLNNEHKKYIEMCRYEVKTQRTKYAFNYNYDLPFKVDKCVFAFSRWVRERNKRAWKLKNIL